MKTRQIVHIEEDGKESFFEMLSDAATILQTMQEKDGSNASG